MFARFWIDSQRISDSLWAKVSRRKSLGKNFGIILSLFWNHGGVGSLMLESRSQNEGNLAAHLHFESKSASASLLKAPQSLPKGVSNRIKVVKRNNHQRIDKLYAFEGGFLVSLDAKMMIFSNKFRRSNYQL